MPESQSALSCVEDRHFNEEDNAGPSYCSHFLPCQLSKLRMMFLFVLQFICCKMVDLTQANTWCAASPISPEAVNTGMKPAFETNKKQRFP